MTTPVTTLSNDTTETHWTCACVKRGSAGKLKAIKLHPKSVKYCRTCGYDQQGYRHCRK